VRLLADKKWGQEMGWAPFPKKDIVENGSGVRVNRQREKERSSRARSRRTPGRFYLPFVIFQIT
jgi:hypothetical protein